MIWLDMDGVFADFDEQYFIHFGYRPTREPDTVDWAKVASVPDFYATMPLMSGAHELFRYVDELGFGCGFLTGVPRSISTTEAQKRKWANREFPDVFVQCCQARDKWQFGEPGDAIIDDYTKYRVEWERMGGIFVHHISAADSIRQLGELVSCGRLHG